MTIYEVKVLEVRKLRKWPTSKSVSCANSMHVIKRLMVNCDTPRPYLNFKPTGFWCSSAFSVTWPSNFGVPPSANEFYLVWGVNRQCRARLIFISSLFMTVLLASGYSCCLRHSWSQFSALLIVLCIELTSGHSDAQSYRCTILRFCTAHICSLPNYAVTEYMYLSLTYQYSVETVTHVTYRVHWITSSFYPFLSICALPLAWHYPLPP